MILQHSPESYSRRILLTLAGHSPAIITETLYALTQVQQPAYIPTEIRIITTSSGKAMLMKTLIGENGVLPRFCVEYGIPPPLFNESCIQVIHDNAGNLLNDLKTDADNEVAADFITDQVRQLTQDDQCSLHVSIAGGRKTMTYYLGYAMSVFGRIQDRMSHVLVDDRYTVPNFYYPTKTSSVITNPRTGDSFDAHEVKVTLGELPFIRLRDGMADDLLNDATKSYGQIIALAQQQLSPVRVEITGQPPQLYCGGVTIKLPPAQLAIYIWLLKNHLANKPSIRFISRMEQETCAREFLNIYEQVAGEFDGHYSKVAEELKRMDTDYFGSHRTKINRTLQSTLGKPRAAAYLIQSSGGRNTKQYYLSAALSVNNISL